MRASVQLSKSRNAAMTKEERNKKTETNECVEGREKMRAVGRVNMLACLPWGRMFNGKGKWWQQNDGRSIVN